VAAFDVAAVCTGFIYALSAGAGLIAAGTAERVIVIGADVYSTIINPDDRSTAILFGDAAGAVVLRKGHAGEPGALGPMILGSDGSHRDLITIPAGGSRQRGSVEPPESGDEFFAMKGAEVFLHALNRMVQASSAALAAAGWSVSDLDRLAAHQANRRILLAVADRLGLPGDVQLTNIADVANTSAASIPVLLDQSVREGLLVPGHKLLMTAFGGGLTWGATTVTWPALGIHD
jgi:3-oxoacyl-[acyl-carrier-protein] synthase-3